MNIILIHDAARIAEASSIAFGNHARLREKYPWLPEKKVEDFVERIGWMTREGSVYALLDGDTMRAFLGWFTLDNFRKLGPGALTPDWCFGVAKYAENAPVSGMKSASSGLERTPGSREVSRLMSPLIRRLINDIKAAGLWTHGVGVPATCDTFLEEFSMLSYGRIVLDAARPAGELLALPCPEPDGFIVRAATEDDARAFTDLIRSPLSRSTLANLQASLLPIPRMTM